MSSIWTGQFWKATAERAVSTAAQSALLVVGADQLNVIAVSWPEVGGFAAGGAVLAVLKALAAGATGGGPGFTDAEDLTTPGRHARDVRPAPDEHLG